MGFKLKVLGGGIQRDTAHALAFSWGIDHTNQGSNKCFLTASQDEDYRAKHIKDVYGYGESSYIPSREPGCMVTSLKCLYTNAHSMVNKQELEICVWSRGWDLIAVTEMWLDSSHDRNIVIEAVYFLKGLVGQVKWWICSLLERATRTH